MHPKRKRNKSFKEKNAEFYCSFTNNFTATEDEPNEENHVLFQYILA
jgi:hypothetical protein